MTNTLTNVIPKILARGLLALREQAIMPRLVNGDYAAEFRAPGTTVDIPLPVPQTAADITPSNTPPAPTANVKPIVSLVLNNWKGTNFHLTDKEIGDINARDSFLPGQVSEAIRALASVVNLNIYANYKGVYGFTGTPGTTPFATANTVTDATNLRKVLNIQRCPKDSRVAVLNFDAEANALNQAPFANLEQTGDQGVKIDGELGRKYGILWVADDQVVTHTSTALTAGATTVNGAHAINAGSTDGGRNGTVSIAKLTNTSPLVNGDILTFATDSQTYTVTADITLIVGNTTVAISPALQTAKVGAEAVTLKASHVVNLGFRRDAIAFAQRPLDDSQLSGFGSKILQVQDPKTGIFLRLEVMRQYKQIVWEYDILYGSKLIRPEEIARLAG